MENPAVGSQNQFLIDKHFSTTEEEESGTPAAPLVSGVSTSQLSQDQWVW